VVCAVAETAGVTKPAARLAGTASASTSYRIGSVGNSTAGVAGVELRPATTAPRHSARHRRFPHLPAVAVDHLPWTIGRVRRIVILGRGASGKSTLARRLGERTGLPVIELDTLFWRPGLTPTPPARWASVQRDLAAGDAWIMDGDLGPYDQVDVRLRAADTVLVLDFSLARCAWRALRRSRERADFWRWLIGYRRHYLPPLMAAIHTHAAQASVRVLRHPRELADLT
jgi:hypothetical protein